MEDDRNRVGTANLICDWCKWYSAIAAGAITAIATLVANTNHPKDHFLYWYVAGSFLAAAILLFLVSIILAGLVLLSLSIEIQKARSKRLILNEKLHSPPMVSWWEPKLAKVVDYVTYCFCGGMIAFAAGVGLGLILKLV